MKLDANQKKVILGHLKNAKAMWEDEGTNTPGASIGEFMMKTYGPGVAKLGQAPKEPKTPDKPTGPMQRYVSYFMPTQDGQLRPMDTKGVPQDTALAGNTNGDEYV